MIPRSDLPQLIEEAASLLDKKMPGWAEKIDLETLDIYEPFDCVLGQLFLDQKINMIGPYSTGIKILEIPTAMLDAFSWNIRPATIHNELWISQIQKRLPKEQTCLT